MATIKRLERERGRIAGRPPAACASPLLEEPGPSVLADVSRRTGFSQERLRKDFHILQRLADLFPGPAPPYALNGGAALNMIYLGSGRRVPSDIDLRCDDLRECSKSLADRFRPAPRRPTNVEVYSFIDENGIVIDLAQDRLGRDKRRLQARSVLHGQGFGQCAVDVLSYDFETLFAEKLMALARKRGPKDLYDAHLCLSEACDQRMLVEILGECRRMEGTDPRIITSVSFRPDGDRTGADSLPSGPEFGFPLRVSSFPQLDTASEESGSIVPVSPLFFFEFVFHRFRACGKTISAFLSMFFTSFFVI